MQGTSRKIQATECTAVAAIQLRMRVRILTRPKDSLANLATGGLCPLPSTRGPPGNGKLSACWGGCEAMCDWSCLVLSCPCMYLKMTRRCFSAGKAVGLMTVSCKGNAVLGRLGKRGSFGSSVLSSPNRPPRRIGVSHGPLHPFVFFFGC